MKKTLITIILSTLQFLHSTTTSLASVTIGTVTSIGGPFDQDLDSGQSVATTLNSLISILIGFLTTIAGLFFLFQILLAGYNWISAGGDSGAITTARDRLIQSLTGLAIVVATYAVAGLIGRLVGITIFNPLNFLLNP